MSASEAEVRDRLSAFQAEIVRGWVPDVLASVPVQALAFAHVDVDLYEPTRAAAAWAYERLAPGGILVCDDYGFDTCPGARQAIDELFAERPEPVVHLPTGRGFVIKRGLR